MVAFPLDLATALERISDAVGTKPAVIDGTSSLTWAAFDEKAAHLAGYLAGRGVGPSDRVAIGATNRPEFLIAMYAALKLSAIPVNVNFRYRAEELLHILDDSAAVALVYDQALSAAVSQIGPQLPPATILLRIDGPGDDSPPGTADFTEAISGPALPRQDRGEQSWMLYTGGTTGRPKAVVRPQSTLVAALSTHAFSLLGAQVPTGPTQFGTFLADHNKVGLTLLAASPLIHGTGIFGALTALLSGGTVVLLTGARFDAAELCTALFRAKVTDLHIVGDVFASPIADELEFAQARQEPYDLSSLRRIQSVGTAWSAEVKRRLLDVADVTLIDLIAATEGGPYAISESQRTTRPADLTAFRLAPGARLLAEDNTDVVPGSGQVGVLAAPTPAGSHYAGDPAATQSAFRTVDGVLYSAPGDMATLDTSGTLRFLGRGSAVINTGGEKVYAGEVEEVLRSHPEVEDVVVIGVPDARWGSAVGAIVEARPGAAPEPTALQIRVASALASYKQPRYIAVVPQLQRTVSGKVDQRWAAQYFSAAPEAIGQPSTT